MAHTYMQFDFGADEEKAQEARRKLDVWKQAFRLDKKLQYKLDRAEDETEDEDTEGESAAEETAKGKSGAEGAAKTAKGNSDSKPEAPGNVSLFVRLYFSSHEKLSEQRWLDRIPTEEPFKSASPKVFRKGEAGFEKALEQFGDAAKWDEPRSKG